MPHLHRAIETCGYNPGAKVIAFRTGNLGVVVEAGRIVINDADTVTKAQEVLDCLKDMIKSAAA